MLNPLDKIHQLCTKQWLVVQHALGKRSNESIVSRNWCCPNLRSDKLGRVRRPVLRRRKQIMASIRRVLQILANTTIGQFHVRQRRIPAPILSSGIGKDDSWSTGGVVRALIFR